MAAPTTKMPRKKKSPLSSQPISPPKILRSIDRSEEARKRLGITAEQMVGQRKVTPILMRASGGIPAIIEALSVDDSPDSILFIAKWDSITESDRDRLTLEEIAVAAGLTPRRLLEVATGAIHAFAEDASRLIVASAKPNIIQKMAENALTQFGEKDREMFLKGKDVDWFPAAKGIVIDNRTQNNTLTNGGQSNEDRSLPPPSADKFLLDMQSVLRPEQLQIEAAITAPVVVANIPELEIMDGDVL